MSVLEFSRYRCLDNDCRHVFESKDAMLVDVPGPSLLVCCPDCYGERVEQITVCAECLKRDPVSGEDLCRDCLLAEQDALDELQLDQYDAHRPKSELSQLCVDVVVPFRRAS